MTIPRWLALLGAWLLVFFLALILAVFLHETGHGIGARLDGIHISTGFNRIGNPGLTPDDPNFRTGLVTGVWTGLLGPAASWLLAIASTVCLYRFRKPTGATLMVGAFAIANSLARGMPIAIVLLRALQGHVETEDEVHWAIWYIARFLRPDLGPGGVQALAMSQPGVLLTYPAFWIPILLSFGISLICLVLACRRMAQLWSGTLNNWAVRSIGLGIPIAAWFAVWPLLNALDRLIRINW